MKTYVLIIICLILAIPAIAKEKVIKKLIDINNPKDLNANEEIWKSGDSYIPIIHDKIKQTMLSKNCEKKMCEAKKVLKTISFKEIDSSMLTGGRNPGAVLCISLTNSRIIYLKDLQGNEQTFCLMKDNSFVSTSSLEIFAKKNDKNN